MSIRQYNPGRNRRGKISLGAERFLYALLLCSIALQAIALNGNKFLFTALIVGAIFNFEHSIFSYGRRYAWSYLLLTLGLSLGFAFLNSWTSWPYGEIKYSKSYYICLVPLIWLNISHPVLVMSRRLSKTWTFLIGAIGVSAWALTIDPIMVRQNLWKWKFKGSTVPWQTHIPISNIFGWLLTSLTVMALLNLLLPKERRKIGVNNLPVDIFLGWALFLNLIGNILIGHQGTALISGLPFLFLLIPYFFSRWFGQP